MSPHGFATVAWLDLPQERPKPICPIDSYRSMAPHVILHRTG